MTTIGPQRLRVTAPSTGEEIEYFDFAELSKHAPIKPNKQFYVDRLLDGVALGIHDLKQYPTFFKLFQRAAAREKSKLRISMRQISPELWLLIPWDKAKGKPDTLLESDFREHGRYKFYAQQLERGESVVIDGEKEAVKTRRAWMLYHTPEQRAGRDCTIKRVRGGKFRLVIE